jgi:hypothetical protein
VPLDVHGDGALTSSSRMKRARKSDLGAAQVVARGVAGLQH